MGEPVMTAPQPLPSPRPLRRMVWMAVACTVIVVIALIPNPMVNPGTPSPRMVLGDMVVNTPFQVQGEEILLPVQLVQNHLDPDLFWEPKTGRLTATTAEKVLTMRTDTLTAYLNERPVELDIPLIQTDAPEGGALVPLSPLVQLLGLTISRPDDQTLVVDLPGTNLITGRVLSKTLLRPVPNQRVRGIGRLAMGEDVAIFGEERGFFRVRTARGEIGYIPKGKAELSGIRSVPLPPNPPPTPWKPVGNKISLVWEHVGKKNPDMVKIGEIPGINVVSPTWFHLADAQGRLTNNADENYMLWARSNGYQVWGLVTNSFDPDLTQKVLRDPTARDNVIRQLLVLARLYGLDGINVDFENMYLADRDYFVQFLRELTPLAREQGLTVSVDVTVKSQSANWSLVYDRKRIAEAVDYVALMTYDEHWASSPQPGPVASLPWVERGLQGVLAEIPADKLLLGIPFYTRLWQETRQEDGSVKVSSRVLSMPAASRLLMEKGITPVLDQRNWLNYATYQEGNTTFKIWLEDEFSLLQRLEMARKYNLAGIAIWRRGFEHPGTWHLIKENLDRYPQQKPLLAGPEGS